MRFQTDASRPLWPAWIGLLPIVGHAAQDLGHVLPFGMDSRYFMQDSNVYWREQLEQMRERQLRRAQGSTPAASNGQPAEPDRCLPLRALRIEGVTLFTPQRLADLVPPPGDCLSSVQLAGIVHALTSAYIGQGYIAARVVPQTSPDGIMTLHVVEGRVDRIVGAPPAAVAQLFPGIVGQPLDLRDLEQGLDQANRLPSLQMHAAIEPGASPETSTIRLDTHTDPPWYGSVSFDNRGYEATGRNVLGANLSYDNPLGRYDFLNLSLDQSLARARHSRRAAMLYTLPYGYWTYSVFASQSEYLNTQPLVYHTVQLTGRSSQYGLRIDRVTARSRSTITSAHLQLAHKRVRNYFLDTLQTLSSPTLTVVEAGIDRTALYRSGVLSLGATVAKGVTWLGADQDRSGADSGLPRAQFLKAGASVFLRQALPAGAGQTAWLESRFFGQASRARLPAIERIELADDSLVRGFRHNSLASAVGFALRNTISVSAVRGALRLTPRLGIDAGRVLRRDSRQSHQWLSGASLGVNIAAGRLAADFEYSRPLAKPADFAPEPQQLLARFSWQL
jgi:hemolysin activation/secretion protein